MSSRSQLVQGCLCLEGGFITNHGKESWKENISVDNRRDKEGDNRKIRGRSCGGKGRQRDGGE